MASILLGFLYGLVITGTVCLAIWLLYGLTTSMLWQRALHSSIFRHVPFFLFLAVMVLLA
jgi:hypothetical protein